MLGVKRDRRFWGNLASRNSRGAGRKSGGSAPGPRDDGRRIWETQTGEEMPQAKAAFEKFSKARNCLRNPGRSRRML